jgi:hypothetical protein
MGKGHRPGECRYGVSLFLGFWGLLFLGLVLLAVWRSRIQSGR